MIIFDQFAVNGSSRALAGPLPPLARQGIVANWLYFCAAMIIIMVLIGGITRLTESGLSIVEWQPFRGIVPPLSPAAWLDLFQQYQTSPQFRTVNQAMSLADFKEIFWWEYIHRLWGRLIGLAYFIPMVIFWIKNYLPRQSRLPLTVIFALGALQGLIGWWMVASGLEHEPRVAPYRLAIHLTLALLLYSATLLAAKGIVAAPAPRFQRSRAWRGATMVLILLFFTTIIAGALVAGLRGGLVYNEFPLMEGQLIPPDYWLPSSGWLNNALQNPVAAQFHHRMLAMTMFVASLVYGLILRRRAAAPLRQWATALVVLACVQVMLGVATLLSQVALPLAVLHQAGALAVLTALLNCAYVMFRPPPPMLD